MQRNWQALVLRLAELQPDVPLVVVAESVRLSAIGLAAARGVEPTTGEVELATRVRLEEWRRGHPDNV